MASLYRLVFRLPSSSRESDPLSIPACPGHSPIQLERGLRNLIFVPGRTAGTNRQHQQPTEGGTEMNTITAATLGSTSEGRTASAIKVQDRVLLFNDLVDSTPLLVRLGDEAFTELLDVLDVERLRLVELHGGRLVNLAGDGALIVFANTDDAVAFAIDFNEVCDQLGIQSRTGIHRGDVMVRSNGDLAGLAVNTAARIESQAPAGGIVASAAAVATTSAPFDQYATVELKGLEGTTDLFSLTRFELAVAA